MNLDSPFEKRQQHRSPYEERGIFVQDGQEGVLIRVRDVCDRGIGAYSRTALRAGVRGILSIKLPHDITQSRYETEVRWCNLCDEADFRIYPYRMGLVLKHAPAVGKSPEKAAGPAPVETPKPEESPYRVKGAMLVDFGKMVRHNHDKPWQKYLTADDMRILTGMIIPSAWYPMDTFRRAGLAVFDVFGQGKLENARQFGRSTVDRIPPDLYRSFFDKKDPRAAIKNYVNINMRVFDFMRFRVREEKSSSIEIAAKGNEDVRKDFPEINLIGEMTGGAAERLAEKNGASEAGSRVIEGADGDLFVIGVQWK